MYDIWIFVMIASCVISAFFTALIWYQVAGKKKPYLAEAISCSISTAVLFLNLYIFTRGMRLFA